LALAHERSANASLPNFLEALEASGADIKRDLSAARGEVRVMTVHGAKGLEAPIVILADACSANERTERFFALPLPGGREVPVWVPRKELDCTATAAGREVAAETLAREDRRLLYVAMTRARDRLIVAGCPMRGKIPQTSWYAMVSNALEHAAPGLVDLPAGEGEAPVRRWRISSAGVPAAQTSVSPGVPREAAPDWLSRPAEPEPVIRPPLRPSSALDAADGTVFSEFPADRDALLAGRFAHALLEHLPALPAERRANAADLLATDLAFAFSAERRRDILAKVLELISYSPAAPLFSARSHAEVSVTGNVDLGGRAGPRPVSGRIDRLVVTEEAVLIADFKTNLPAAGRGRERAFVQLAIYRALIRDLYPALPIRCFLIGLDGPLWIEPAEVELEGALALLGSEAAPRGAG
jgi:ATP-dependent helicase/nuclease subunit A